MFCPLAWGCRRVSIKPLRWGLCGPRQICIILNYKHGDQWLRFWICKHLKISIWVSKVNFYVEERLRPQGSLGGLREVHWRFCLHFPFFKSGGKKSKQQQQTTNTPYFPVSQKNQFDSQCDSTNLIFTSLVYSPQLIDRCLALQPEIEMYRSEGSQVLGFGCKFLAFLWAISLLCILFPLLLAKEGGLRCFYPFWGWQNSF